MKKITFILFALIAGTTFAQESDAATATVGAAIVSPISIESLTNLDFGKVLTTAGTVIIAPDGSRTGTGEFVTATTSTPTAASFTVNAAADYVYNVSYAMSVALTNGTDILAVTSFTNDAGTDARTGTGGDEEMTVGATLTLDGTESVGNYAGEVTVTVAYQ